MDNKLSIHFGEGKTKPILFSSKSKVKESKPLNIQYKGKKVKQYSKVTHLGCILDETLSGESMAIYVTNKVNSRLRFLYLQNKFLNKNVKTHLQAAQNKCIRFCLKPGNSKSITLKK